MRLNLIDWNASESIGPMFAREAQNEDKRDLKDADEFCEKLNAILDKGGNCSLVNQRELYDAVGAIRMPTGFNPITCLRVRLAGEFM